MIEEKAKRKITQVMNSPPTAPNSDAITDWVRLAPAISVAPVGSYWSDSRMMKAVAEQITMVSTKTPSAWMKPCVAG